MEGRVEAIPFGTEQKGEGVKKLLVTRRAVSKFNDQPDSRSHSGSPPRIRFWEDSFRVVLPPAMKIPVRNSTFSHARVAFPRDKSSSPQIVPRLDSTRSQLRKTAGVMKSR